MVHLIDKSALVAEIENIRKHYIERDDFDNGWNFALDKVLSIINTLEVKEVDLDVMQRMEECPYRQVGCTMYEGHILECKGACSWVVDHLKLKELKAQKGDIVVDE